MPATYEQRTTEICEEGSAFSAGHGLWLVSAWNLTTETSHHDAASKDAPNLCAKPDLILQRSPYKYLHFQACTARHLKLTFRPYAGRYQHVTWVPRTLQSPMTDSTSCMRSSRASALTRARLRSTA